MVKTEWREGGDGYEEVVRVEIRMEITVTNKDTDTASEQLNW